MSSVVSLASAMVAKNAAEANMDLGSTLTKIANNADNAMTGILDKLVQQGMQNNAAAPEGMGKAVDIKA